MNAYSHNMHVLAMWSGEFQNEIGILDVVLCAWAFVVFWNLHMQLFNAFMLHVAHGNTQDIEIINTTQHTHQMRLCHSYKCTNVHGIIWCAQYAKPLAWRSAAAAIILPDGWRYERCLTIILYTAPYTYILQVYSNGTSHHPYTGDV